MSLSFVYHEFVCYGDIFTMVLTTRGALACLEFVSGVRF